MREHEFENVQALCPGCGTWFATVTEDGKLDKEIRKCANCGREMKAIRWADIQEVEALLDIAEMELENGNRHSFVDTPRNLYHTVEEYIPPKNRVVVARIIADQFIRSV
jgi:NMD protein affecting ribosome stability and mRNA decay